MCGSVWGTVRGKHLSRSAEQEDCSLSHEEEEQDGAEDTTPIVPISLVILHYLGELCH